MEFTDDYVYVNEKNIQFNPDSTMTFPLGLSTDRVPIMMVEVIQAEAYSSLAFEGLVFKTDNIAQNYSSPDRKGTCLAILSKLYSIKDYESHHYGLGGGVTGKLVFSGNLSTLTIYLTTLKGVPVPMDYVTGFSVMLKISRPRQDAIQPAYRAQIPL